ncbi:vicilin-like seed storage protein [Iris pallida]|uniref:Vicilin-like seed storage protein n=1 Tax=Iris pallida TaxID=29817 RepID=A0AAX6GG12_IRIPA|nr:vicilin-like seed storage protein [Iris pallida]
MAEEYNESAASNVEKEAEVRDRGMFDFLRKKKEDKEQEQELVTGVEKLHVEEEKKGSLSEKLHRSKSSSSSSLYNYTVLQSSDEEEVGEGENKEKKKKKGLKEKIKEELHHKEEGEKVAAVADHETVVPSTVPAPPPAAVAHHHYHDADTSIPVEKVGAAAVKVETAPAPAAEEEKKGFLDKIKGKLHKKDETTTTHVAVGETAAKEDNNEVHGEDAKEKKGIFGKLMEKLPGYHKEETSPPPVAHE